MDLPFKGDKKVGLLSRLLARFRSTLRLTVDQPNLSCPTISWSEGPGSRADSALGCCQGRLTGANPETQGPWTAFRAGSTPFAQIGPVPLGQTQCYARVSPKLQHAVQGAGLVKHYRRAAFLSVAYALPHPVDPPSLRACSRLL